MSQNIGDPRESDFMDKLLKILSESERRELVKIMSDDLKFKGKRLRQWNHPIYVNVLERYHQCAGCGAAIEDEVITVVFRERGGDTIKVFDKRECFENFVWE